MRGKSTHTRISQEAPAYHDESGYSNQIALEYLLSEARTFAHLFQGDSAVQKRGNVATFINAVIVSPRYVLGTKTSIETGTILEDGVTYVEWETLEYEGIGHWRGVWPIVVTNRPPKKLPQPVIEPLHDPDADPADLHYLPYAKTKVLPSLTIKNLQEKVDHLASQKAWQDAVDDLLNQENALVRLRNFLVKQCERSNFDRISTNVDDLRSEVDLQIIQAIRRFASPDRPLGAGTITTYLPANVKRDVKRATMKSAGIPQAPAEMLQKMYASDVDMQRSNTQSIADRIDETGTQEKPTNKKLIEAATQVDHIANAVSLQSSTGSDDDGSTELGNLFGTDDPDYALVSDTNVSDLEKLAAVILIGSRVPQNKQILSHIARWIDSFLVQKDNPTPDDLYDLESGWPTALWVFTPLLRKGEDVTDETTANRLRKRIERMMTKDVSKKREDVRWRTPSDIREVWDNYIQSPRWLQRDDLPPLGVEL